MAHLNLNSKFKFNKPKIHTLAVNFEVTLFHLLASKVKMLNMKPVSISSLNDAIGNV